jgi:hypothetical protein
LSFLFKSLNFVRESTPRAMLSANQWWPAVQGELIPEIIRS